MKYEQAKLLIAQAAANTFRPKGLYLDLISEGNLTYVRCRRRHRKGVSFERFLKFQLKRRMIDMVRSEMQQRTGRNRSGQPLLHRVPLHGALPVFMPRDWTDDLSNRSLAVMRLALQSREDLQPKQIRRSIVKYLISAGWSVREVINTFKEIRGAIS